MVDLGVSVYRAAPLSASAAASALLFRSLGSEPSADPSLEDLCSDPATADTALCDEVWARAAAGGMDDGVAGDYGADGAEADPYTGENTCLIRMLGCRLEGSAAARAALPRLPSLPRPLWGYPPLRPRSCSIAGAGNTKRKRPVHVPAPAPARASRITQSNLAGEGAEREVQDQLHEPRVVGRREALVPHPVRGERAKRPLHWKQRRAAARATDALPCACPLCPAGPAGGVQQGSAHAPARRARQQRSPSRGSVPCAHFLLTLSARLRRSGGGRAPGEQGPSGDHRQARAAAGGSLRPACHPSAPACCCVFCALRLDRR